MYTTKKQLQEEAQEGEYDSIYSMIYYWAECGYTDFNKEFSTYTSALLFDILDEVTTNETWDKEKKYKLYCAITNVLKARLRIKG